MKNADKTKTMEQNLEAENKVLKQKIERLEASNKEYWREIEEMSELLEQIGGLTALIPLRFKEVSLISQRKALEIFGYKWLQEKEKAAQLQGVRLWVRTGGHQHSPKKYDRRQLQEILEWERENGLPYDFYAPKPRKTRSRGNV